MYQPREGRVRMPRMMAVEMPRGRPVLGAGNPIRLPRVALLVAVRRSSTSAASSTSRDRRRLASAVCAQDPTAPTQQQQQQQLDNNHNVLVGAKVARCGGRTQAGTIIAAPSLMHLCQTSQWTLVLERLYLHPQQAKPVPLRAVTAATSSHSVTLHEDTVLGLACRNTHLDLAMLVAILQACPEQVLCHQRIAGHTPLRDLLRNTACTVPMLDIIIHTIRRQDMIDVYAYPDRDGLRPIDHLIHRIVMVQNMTNNDLPATTDAMLLLKAFVANLPDIETTSRVLLCNNQRDGTSSSSPPSSSPLIRLLSMGNSAHHDHYNSNNNKDDVLSRISNTVQFLLRTEPKLAHQRSQTTDCSVLHVALRNYGNYAPLVKYLLHVQDGGLETDDTTASAAIDLAIVQSWLKHTNRFGDLPIHVACSVGVPLAVLMWLLQGTTTLTTTDDSHVNYCWIMNSAGYTPIDLEWIRHIENNNGNGLLSPRTFYPLEASGVRNITGWNQQEFYRTLLQQAVQQHLQHQQQTAITAAKADATHQENAGNTARPSNFQSSSSLFQPEHPHHYIQTWDLLLHRIFLLIQTAATGRVPDDVTLLNQYLLHAACVLSSPQPPSLPLPLLELILSMYPHQVMQGCYERKQENSTKPKSRTRITAGNLPLHCAVQHLHHQRESFSKEGEGVAADPPTDGDAADRVHTCEEWEAWIRTLLQHSPQACAVVNQDGRLPLHVALDPTLVGAINESREVISTTTLVAVARGRVVEALVDAYPDSVQRIDPVTQLLPFQLAAARPVGANGFCDLDTIFYLLRRSPDAVLTQNLSSASLD